MTAIAKKITITGSVLVAYAQVVLLVLTKTLQRVSRWSVQPHARLRAERWQGRLQLRLSHCVEVSQRCTHLLIATYTHVARLP